MSWQSYTEFVEKTTNLNRQIYNIIEDKRMGIDTTSKITSFFELLEKLKENVIRFYNIKTMDKKDDYTVITQYEQDIKELYNSFYLNLTKINEELKKEFPSLTFHFERLEPKRLFIFGQVDWHPNDKDNFTRSEIYIRADNLRATLIIELAKIENHIKEKHKNMRQMDKDLQYINIMSNILNNPKIRDYCSELFENYNDVIYLKNNDSRIRQASIIQEDLLYMIPPEIFTSMGHWMPKKALSIQSIEPDFVATQNIFDIFDEDDEYYYGIYNNIKVKTLKTNCNDKIPVSELLSYFVVNDKIINYILNQDVNMFKCKLLLFEYPIGCIVTRSEFMGIEHGQNAVIALSGDRCPWSLRDRLIREIHYEQFPYKINLFYFNKKKFYGGSNIFNNQINSLFINNYIKLLLNLNNSNNLKSIINLRCILTRNKEDIRRLYNEIETRLNFDRRPQWIWNTVPSATDIPNKKTLKIPKLLHFYFNEIKLLFLYNFMKKANIYDSRYIWTNYLQRYNLPFDTNPEGFLYYILTDVLTINQTFVKDMLIKIGGSMELLVERMKLKDLHLISNLLEQQIVGLLAKKDITQDAGLARHKSKLSKRKYKTAKKQLENKQKISRKQKTSRK